MATVAELDKRLEQLRRMAANLEGRHDQLKVRDEELTRAVGLAKGRLALKAKTDEFLEALQAAAHQRTVGSYAKLLTALAQDVLPQDLSIGLDLYTERGLPALDIFAQQGDQRVDILEGCGGSLTNVISLGLRTIATVKAGMRSFLALDEPDCWIKPDRVPAFYRVQKQMAERMGFQALIISHHDISLFDSGINVIEMSGTPAEGLSVAVRAGAPEWPDDATPGIRALVLRNFASYKDVRIPLSPGVNAVIGDNNIGKSRIMRMFRSVAYAGPETSDDDIRHGERRAEVEIHLEYGRVLHWSREIRRNPVTLWRLVEADGSVATVEGAHCETGGRQAPEWVAKVLGIARLDGLDIQLAHQKFPVFLLGEPASKRAAVLSIGRESGHLRKMIAAHKDNCARDQVTVKTGEQELANVRRQRSALDVLPDILALIDEAAALREKALEAQSSLADLEAAGIRLAQARRARERAERELRAIGELPEPPELHADIGRARELGQTINRLERLSHGLERARAEVAVLECLPAEAPEIPLSDPIAAAGRRIRDTGLALQAARAEAAVLADLPTEPPALPDTRDLCAAVERLSRLRKGRAEAERELAKSEAEAQVIAVEIAETLASIGNQCPLCGSNVAHDHITGSGVLEAA